MIVGIDLGTTHSLIGAYFEDGPELFKNSSGNLLTPSVVSINEEGILLIGEAARERLTTHPESTIAAFKRQMGTTQTTKLGNKNFRPEELSAMILRALIADAEAATNQKVTEAIISVPAYFSDAQRKATKAAGELAGIKVERLINEPTAAALAYGLQEQSEGGQFLIFDLGGGTFDVSILEIFEGVVEVHASAGDNFLGGEDFTHALLNAFCHDAAIDLEMLSSTEHSLLLFKIEKLKRELSKDKKAVLTITLLTKNYDWAITEEEFIELCEPLMQRIRAPIERAVRDAKINVGELDEIVLVGGASRMSLISKMVTKMFKRLPLRHFSPDEVIAIGAVIASGLKARNHQLEEIILTDVCPYTLGIETARHNTRGKGYSNGFFMPIISRNTTVPVSRVETISPLHDKQTEISINVYQGEHSKTEKNILLGSFTVNNIPSDFKKNRTVDVRFTYDINGLLQVEAKVNETGKVTEKILQHSSSSMSKEEIVERFKALSALKTHPRDQQDNIALLARADRLYQEYLEYRGDIQEWIVHFQNILESQDEVLIIEAKSSLLAMLDEIEGTY